MTKKEFKPFIIAVYGSLRRDFGNHRILKDSEYLGEFKTKELFDLYSLGAYPFISERGDTEITVELYKVVCPIIAQNLDRLEGYPSFYNRKVIEIKDFTSELKTYIYYIIDKHSYINNNKINSGDWKLFKNK